MRRCVLAFAAFVAVATEAAAATSFGAVHRSITGARRASAGRAGPLLSDLSHSTPDTNEELGTTAGSGFMYYGDSLKKPTRMSLRGGSPMDGGNGERLNIVFVSAEVAPWSVTGGLGAVCAHWFLSFIHSVRVIPSVLFSFRFQQKKSLPLPSALYLYIHVYVCVYIYMYAYTCVMCVCVCVYKKNTQCSYIYMYI
jgi:hypothetical protein